VLSGRRSSRGERGGWGVLPDEARQSFSRRANGVKGTRMPTLRIRTAGAAGGYLFDEGEHQLSVRQLVKIER